MATDWQTQWGYLMNWGAWFVLGISLASFMIMIGRIVISNDSLDQAMKLLWPLVSCAIATSASTLAVIFFN
ncbi:hypothetical protein CGZ98_06065 [Enemella evansiae]|uniref:hypothetical protein n=1 Tax=Enemella evansiae TaxID=2016499 RepID=UPI000B95FF20|nr:hypothetical protein [Enemella evansiae]OYO13107.1 hypothetical protein CGZ98_06065 [Enemella evansiae]